MSRISALEACPHSGSALRAGRVRCDARRETRLGTGTATARRSEQDQSSAPPGSELRSAPRYALLIRTAKIIADGREFLCIIRDASATGLKIRLFCDLPRARELIVELVTGDRYPVELVWAKDDFAGLRFREDIDVQLLLDESRGAHPKRQVRLQIAVGGVLHSGGEAVPVVFRNLSQQGACVESDKWLLMNELVRLETGVTPRSTQRSAGAVTRATA